MKLEPLDLFTIMPPVKEQAYEIAFSLRRKGFTIPAVDLIVAALYAKESLLNP